MILDEDGSVLVSAGSALTRLDGTRRPRPHGARDPYRGALIPHGHAYTKPPRLALGADGLLVATVGPRLVEIDRRDDSPGVTLSLDGVSDSPRLDPSGWLVVRTADGARARRRSPEGDVALLAPPPRANDDDAWEALRAGNCDEAALPATNGELIALALEAPAIRGNRLYHFGGHRLRVFDVRGRRRFTASLGGFWLAPPVFVSGRHPRARGARRPPALALSAPRRLRLRRPHALGARGVPVRRVGERPGGSKYALAALPDGTACVATDIDVVRVDRDGARAWRRPVDRRGKFANDLCLDRDGAVYVPESGSLTAFSPDGHRLFRVPQALVPLAIDARGRLLARGRAGAGSDRLVALS